MVVAEIASLCGYQVIGYLERDKKELNPLNIRYFGMESDLSEISSITEYLGVMGIGDNHLRMDLFNKLENLGFSFPKLIHPESMVSKSSSIGPGTVVMRGVCVNPQVGIGINCVLNTGCVIEHDCTIGDHTHLAPNSTILGGVSIGNMSLIGGGSVIMQNVTIGENVTIGAGSVVLHDIPDGETWIGNPATKLR